jgi:hypothetical protein
VLSRATEGLPAHRTYICGGHLYHIQLHILFELFKHIGIEAALISLVHGLILVDVNVLLPWH